MLLIIWWMTAMPLSPMWELLPIFFTLLPSPGESCIPHVAGQNSLQ
jgi:hypothetical protein